MSTNSICARASNRVASVSPISGLDIHRVRTTPTNTTPHSGCTNDGSAMHRSPSGTNLSAWLESFLQIVLRFPPCHNKRQSAASECERPPIRTRESRSSHSLTQVSNFEAERSDTIAGFAIKPANVRSCLRSLSIVFIRNSPSSLYPSPRHRKIEISREAGTIHATLGTLHLFLAAFRIVRPLNSTRDALCGRKRRRWSRGVAAIDIRRQNYKLSARGPIAATGCFPSTLCSPWEMMDGENSFPILGILRFPVAIDILWSQVQAVPPPLPNIRSGRTQSSNCSAVR